MAQRASFRATARCPPARPSSACRRRRARLLLAGGKGADAHAGALAGRGVDHLGVGAHAGALGLLARLAHRRVLGKSAHLDDEAAALAVGGRRRGIGLAIAATFEQGAGTIGGFALGTGFGVTLGLRLDIAFGLRAGIAPGLGLGLGLGMFVVAALAGFFLAPGTLGVIGLGTGGVVGLARFGGARRRWLGAWQRRLSLARGATTGAAGAPEATTSSRSPKLAPAGTGSGMRSGATLSLSGMVMGASTATGRGWVSNSSGKPMTASSTSTAAPIRRWRARRRTLSMVSCGAAAAAACGAARTGLGLGLAALAELEKCHEFLGQPWASWPGAPACRRGVPCSSTPPTV
jgi:hypothetical protein